MHTCLRGEESTGSGERNIKQVYSLPLSQVSTGSNMGPRGIIHVSLDERERTKEHLLGKTEELVKGEGGGGGAVVCV